MEEISPQREGELQEIEKKLGTSFLNKALLNKSLTHSSYGHEHKIDDNERLEFLGDAILKLVISEYIYNKFPEKAEGDLTKIRAVVISDDILSNVGRRLNLGDFLLLSDNERKTGGDRRKSNLANVFEAIIGAVYIDAGLGKSRDLILGALEVEVEKASRAGFIRDYKSALQEFAQKRKWELPRYRVINEAGPRHRRVFWMEVKVKGKSCGTGRGRNKKEAEQRAAMQALRNMKLDEKSKKKFVKEESGFHKIISQVRKRIRP
jgi:ribonuclease-3